VQAGERWFIGPDNGLFAILLRRAAAPLLWEITWRPARLSASFHGRDLFAPVAALLARGAAPGWIARAPATAVRPDWPDDLAEIVYVDHYGNALTGLRAAALPPDAALLAAGRRIPRARTFAEAAPGATLWYENSNGLAEIAVNLGRADQALGLRIGSPVMVAAPAPAA
jgi:S-adenosylmethionine hydrolase